jgi:hypothetical protein
LSLLLLALGFWALAQAQTVPTLAARPTTEAAPAPSGLTDLPQAAQATISASLGRDDPAYQVAVQGTRLHTENPQHGLAVDFTSVVKVAKGQARFALALTGVGYGESPCCLLLRSAWMTPQGA